MWLIWVDWALPLGDWSATKPAAVTQDRTYEGCIHGGNDRYEGELAERGETKKERRETSRRKMEGQEVEDSSTLLAPVIFITPWCAPPLPRAAAAFFSSMRYTVFFKVPPLVEKVGYLDTELVVSVNGFSILSLVFCGP